MGRPDEQTLTRERVGDCCDELISTAGTLDWHTDSFDVL